MNLTKTKKVVAAGLSALMMMCSATPVFAAESGDKSANLNYQVSSSYDWIIHSAIDFGADAGVGHTVDRTGNQVKVLKNVIPEGKYLNISVKGSGVNDAFTVSNGGSEVLNYDVLDDNGAVGVNGNVLSVPSGTNTATQNMNFKLNTTKKSAEVAGQYKGQVIYNASVGDKNGGTTSGGSTSSGTGSTGGSESSGGTVTTPDGIVGGKTIKIDNKEYDVLKQTGNNKFLVCKSMMNFNYESYPTFNNSAKGTDNFNIYEGSDIDNYLEKTWYPSLSDKLKNAIEVAEITQASYDLDDNTKELLIEKKYDTNHNGQKYNTIKRHVYLPSVEDLQTLPTSIKNTRDAIHTENDKYVQYLGQSYGNVSTYTDGYAGRQNPIPSDPRMCMCPAFIINLSKVEYELVN